VNQNNKKQEMKKMKMVYVAIFGLALGLSLFAGGNTVNAESKNLIVITSEENFDSAFLKSEILCALDFYADWCPPCRILEPVFAKLSDDYAGKVKFGKLNIDTYPSLAKRYDVDGIPCIIFFKDGKEVSRVVGLQDAEKYKEEIERLLK
jgi:thioredoxin 1